MQQGGSPLERVRYTPYGTARHSRPADIDGDGDTDSADQTFILNAWGATIGAAGYLCEADLNRDGVINSTDNTYYLNDLGPALPAGRLSAVDNPVGFAGYLFNDDNALYTVRHRTYSTDQGRWLERDPAGYVDGSGLYEYVSSDPSNTYDPMGLLDICGSCQSQAPWSNIFLVIGPTEVEIDGNKLWRCEWWDFQQGTKGCTRITCCPCVIVPVIKSCINSKQCEKLFTFNPSTCGLSPAPGSSCRIFNDWP